MYLLLDLYVLGKQFEKCYRSGQSDVYHIWGGGGGGTILCLQWEDLTTFQYLSFLQQNFIDIDLICSPSYVMV